MPRASRRRPTPRSILALTIAAALGLALVVAMAIAPGSLPGLGHVRNWAPADAAPTSAAVAVAAAAAAAASSAAPSAVAEPAPVVVPPAFRDSGGVRVFRVCSDPNNLPYSNRRQEGYENRIAELVARDLGARLEYTWWAQRRGYVRNSLAAGLCDVMIGVPTGLDRVLATRPYYRSTYTFVSRQDGPRVTSFDDSLLRRVRVGVQIIGDDFANSPPADALMHRGIVDNVRGYTVFGDYGKPSPQSGIVRAVADGEVDVAVVWGPLAAYFARRSPVPLRVEPVSPEVDLPYLPFVFDMAMGVRHGETALRDTLDAVILRKRAEIDSILADYGVPRADSRPRG